MAFTTVPRFLPRLLACAIALGAAGCSSKPTAGGQTGGIADACRPVASTVLDPSDASPLGFSAAEVLATFGGTQTAKLTWAKGGETALSMAVAPDQGQIRYLDREWVDEGGATAEPAVGTTCPDVVEIPITFGFATDDGAFAESWHGSLLAESAESASFTTAIDLDALQGSYVVTEIDETAFDDVTATLQATFSMARMIHGSVDGQAAQSGSQTASAHPFAIATF